MRETPQFARLQELNRFSYTLQIFEANYRELDRLLWFVCDSPAGDQLFQRENRSAWEQAMKEVIRLLQNFVASVTALVDHSRRLYRRMYQPSDSFPEYEEEAMRRFANNEVVQFVQGLRNFCLHYRTPSIGTTMTLVDLQNEKFEKRVTLSKADLLDFDWNASAKRFIEGAPASIDLRESLDAYHSAIEDFYDWFSQRIRILHVSDYETVSDVYASLLTAKQEQHRAALESRLKAFEAGIGTPFDVLNPFMTPSDGADLAPLLRNPEEWVDAAIERVSRYFEVSSDTAPRLLAVIRRHRESSFRVG
jgi:hypothetical protein